MKYLLTLLLCCIFFQGCKEERDYNPVIDKDAEKITEKIESEINGVYDNGVCIPKSVNSYPRVIIGKDDRKYVASLSALYDKNKKLRVRIDVSGAAGEYFWTSWEVECHAAEKPKK